MAQRLPAPARDAEPSGETAGEIAALRRELDAARDRLDLFEARLARLKPVFVFLGVLRFLVGLARRAAGFVFAVVAQLWRWPQTVAKVRGALARSRRFGRGDGPQRIDPKAFARQLGAAFGLARAPAYRVRPRQRIGLSVRPRVLHAIANLYVGGSTQLVLDLFDHLGHRVEMEALTSALPPQGAPAGMPTTLAPQPAPRLQVRAAFARLRPHLVHIHYWGDVDEPWYRAVFEAAAEFGCPVVQNVNTPVAPFLHEAVARNVFVSQSVLDRFGSKAKACVIHPGVDLALFAPRRIEDPQAFDTVGMIYRLEKDKLGPQTIELLVALVKLRPRTRVVIVGDGALFAPFRARVEAEGLLHAFEFTGYVPYAELPGHLARFRTFVAPVWQESFGQVVPFAMSAGLAVAGFRVGAIPEILGSDETLGEGVTDTAALIAALIEDPERVAAIGRRNHVIARRLYSVEAMAAAYARVYEEVLPAEFDLAPGLPRPELFPL
ncbi:glycosyltransferase family 4 protein [Methylocella sp.]|uniref:glycosyltransferase family 4 protein n=1 Tax=Methylocella sp. TaxID=1978226 RepID=UPI003782F6E6